MTGFARCTHSPPPLYSGGVGGGGRCKLARDCPSVKIGRGISLPPDQANWKWAPPYGPPEYKGTGDQRLRRIQAFFSNIHQKSGHFSPVGYSVLLAASFNPLSPPIRQRIQRGSESGSIIQIRKDLGILVTRLLGRRLLASGFGRRGRFRGGRREIVGSGDPLLPIL